MVRTVSPKANATPRKPMPSSGNAAESTAEPQPPKVSQKVPQNSATDRCKVLSFMVTPHKKRCDFGRLSQLRVDLNQRSSARGKLSDLGMDLVLKLQGSRLLTA